MEDQTQEHRQPRQPRPKAARKKAVDRSERSLSCLVQAVEGKKLVVELRNDLIIRGTLDESDEYMNLSMSDVSCQTVTGDKSQYEFLYVRGRNIRFLHLPGTLDPSAAVEQQRKKLVDMRIAEYKARQSQGRQSKEEGGLALLAPIEGSEEDGQENVQVEGQAEEGSLGEEEELERPSAAQADMAGHAARVPGYMPGVPGAVQGREAGHTFAHKSLLDMLEEDSRPAEGLGQMTAGQAHGFGGLQAMLGGMSGGGPHGMAHSVPQQGMPQEQAAELRAQTAPGQGVQIHSSQAVVETIGSVEGTAGTANYGVQGEAHVDLGPITKLEDGFDFD